MRGKWKAWTREEIDLVHTYMDDIQEESNGGVSDTSPTLRKLTQLLPQRGPSSVHNKVRIELQRMGKIVTKESLHKASAEKAQPELEQSPKHEAVLKEQGLVLIPLKKLYGKVDFATFMELINED
jgi:hypothetical protein